MSDEKEIQKSFEINESNDNVASAEESNNSLQIEETEQSEEQQASKYAVGSRKQSKEFGETTDNLQYVVTLAGTHTSCTDTEVIASEQQRLQIFDNIRECLPAEAPTTSRISEHIKECLEQNEGLVILEATMQAHKLVQQQAHQMYNELQRTQNELVLPLKQTAAKKALVTAESLQQVERENQEIAERFQQIMEMFDNFTRNLESLEISTTSIPGLHSATKECARSSRDGNSDSSPESLIRNKYISPRVHKSRYANYMKELQRKQGIKAKQTPCQEIRVEPLPHNRSLSAVSSTNLLVEAVPLTVEPVNASIACQTSQQQLGLTTCSNTTLAANERTEPCLVVKDQETPMSANIENNDDHITTLNAIEDDNSNMPKLLTDSTEDSHVMLAKMSTDSIIELTAALSANVNACFEHTGGATIATTATADATPTFHTIHIETTSSPSSSIMRRPPLCVRFWNVLSDFCAAICLCLQVNKDCIFCLGFFIAFVVSASFLTAFFYSTLSVNPQLYSEQLQQQQLQQHQQHPTSNLFHTYRDNYYLLE